MMHLHLLAKVLDMGKLGRSNGRFGSSKRGPDRDGDSPGPGTYKYQERVTKEGPMYSMQGRYD